MKDYETISVPDMSEVSEYLSPTLRKDLKEGIRLDLLEIGLLVGVANHTLGSMNAKRKATFEIRHQKEQVRRLLKLGYVEDANLKQRTLHPKVLMAVRITEKGVMRLLDPESLIILETMDR